jgi:ABC-type bacteriocin/lantibiotic exporter with double-glycine peptidase domain
MSKSPIISHFSETLNGISTIKSYKEENRFIKEFQHKIDENNVYFSNGFNADRFDISFFDQIKY